MISGSGRINFNIPVLYWTFYRDYSKQISTKYNGRNFEIGLRKWWIDFIVKKRQKFTLEKEIMTVNLQNRKLRSPWLKRRLRNPLKRFYKEDHLLRSALFVTKVMNTEVKIRSVFNYSYYVCYKLRYIILCTRYKSMVIQFNLWVHSLYCFNRKWIKCCNENKLQSMGACGLQRRWWNNYYFTTPINMCVVSQNQLFSRYDSVRKIASSNVRKD